MADELLLLLSQTVLISIPLVLTAIGGTFSERAGVVNIALEGVLLSGAFAGASVGFATQSVLAGACAGVFAGVLVSMLHGFLSVTMRCAHIVSGLAVNLLAQGSTEYGAHLVWPEASVRTLPRLLALHPFGFDLLDTLFGQPFAVLTIAVIALAAFSLSRTVFGLRIHAVGENPAACDTLGVSVSRMRYLAVGISGALAGLAGAWLAFNVGQFQHGMSAGRGYVAMAAVVFGKWRPTGAVLACMLFAFSEAFAASLERSGVPIPSELIGTLPYVLSMIALVVVGGARAPAALGVPYDKSL